MKLGYTPCDYRDAGPKSPWIPPLPFGWRMPYPPNVRDPLPLVGPGTNFPVDLTAWEIYLLFWRVKSLRISGNVHTHFDGYDPVTGHDGDFVDQDHLIDFIAYRYDGPADPEGGAVPDPVQYEISLLKDCAAVDNTHIGFNDALRSGQFKGQFAAVDETGELDVGLLLNTTCSPYDFSPDRFHLFLVFSASGQSVTVSTAYNEGPFPSSGAVDTTLSFLGKSVQLAVPYIGDYPYPASAQTGSLSIEVLEYFQYADADGSNPLFDASTGDYIGPDPLPQNVSL